MATPKSYNLVFLDLTTTATPDAFRPAQAVDEIEEALVEQLATDYALAYGGRTVNLRIGNSTTDRMPDEIAINLRDALPEAPDADGYHQTTNGIADIEIACSLASSLTSGPGSLSVVISHEVLEMLGDEGANGWKDRQDASGTMDAEELCDFVQNTSKPMSNGVHVSNFVLPSFFVPGSVGPWDNQGVMTSQYDVSNGYSITSQRAAHSIGNAKLVVRHEGDLTESQKIRKSHPWSRTHRRGVRGL